MHISSTTMLLAVGAALACAPDRAADEPAAATSTSSAGGSLAADAAELGQLAQQVTQRGLRTRKGDVVMIAGGAHTIPLMEALALETAKVGAHYQLGQLPDELRQLGQVVLGCQLQLDLHLHVPSCWRCRSHSVHSGLRRPSASRRSGSSGQ